MNVFDLSAILRLDKSGYDRGLNEADSQFSSFGSKLKSGLGTVVKLTGVAIAAGATAAGAIVRQATDAYANYEQLVGGIETLFGAQGMGLEEYAESVGKTTDEVADQYNQLLDAQNLAMANASKAYKTAGLSKNQYMETISGFAASLKQSVSSETEAAEVADRAVTDMADNANKMGTSMESIQNAYMGFSKQNYMMLDNLKLGYGGTKTEMERLIKDASKMTKEQKDLNVAVKDGDMSFGNIVNAISVMQKHLGIAGTTAKEASTTIQGSANAARSAWQNVLVGIADDTQDFGALIDEFVNSASTYIGNLLPRIETALGGIGKLIENLAPIIAEKLPELVENLLPGFIDAGISIVEGLISALPRILSALAKALYNGLQKIFDRIGLEVDLDGVFDLFKSAWKIVIDIFKDIKKAAGPVIKTIVSIFNDVVGVLKKILSNKKAVEVIKNMVIAFIGFKAVTSVVGKVQSVVGGLFKLIAANPIMAMVTGVVAVTGAMIAWSEAISVSADSFWQLSEAEQEYLNKVNEEAEAWRNEKAAREEALSNATAEITQAQDLWGELQKIVDENGNIKRGYEERAAVITGILAEALGTEITIVDGQIQKYGELKKTIDEVIQQQKASVLLKAGEQDYADALLNVDEQLKKVKEAEGKVTEAQKAKERALVSVDYWQKMYNKAAREGSSDMWQFNYELGLAKQRLADREKQLEDYTAAHEAEAGKYGDYIGTISAYENLLGASTSNSVEEMDKASKRFVEHAQKTESELVTLGKNASKWGQDMMHNFASGIGDKGYEVEKAVKKVTKMVNRNLGFSEPEEGYLSNFHTYAPDMMKLWAKGIKDNAWRVMDEVKSVTGAISSGVTGSDIETGGTDGGGASININVYGAEGQDVSQLADEVSERIALQYDRLRMAF